MDEYTEYNEFEKQSIKEKLKEVWYNKKKYIIVLACVIIVLLVVLIVTVSIKNKTPNKEKYKDIETIMLLNAQNYVKNNKIEKDIYISLNYLNLKIDDELKCNTISGVYRKKDSFYPYLICEGYKSNTIEEVIEENKRNKEYGELKGDNPLIVNESSYQEEGIESKYEVNIKGDDIENGLNIVTYYLNEKGKYVGEIKRIVIAEDIEGSYPVLTLYGNKTRTISRGSSYKESGYEAKDDYDGNITDKVKIEGEVDTNKVGTYKIRYSVTNTRNKTTIVERTVIVTESDINLEISHTIEPNTITKKSVTMKVVIKGNGYKYTMLPDNSKKEENEVTYTVYKNGTYDFIIYDTNDNSEVYSVKITNIDTTPPYPTITSVEHKAGIVTINAKKNKYDLNGYYFSTTSKKPTGKEDTWVEKKGTKYQVAKIPGTYYVYVKDTKNNISPSKKVTITIEDLYNDGPQSRSRKNQLDMQIHNLLATKNDTIDNYNDFIADSVKSAGLFTTEGIATAAVAVTNYLWNNYHTQIPYISNVDCTATRYNDHFGINPRWGILIATPGSARAIECEGSHVGFDCASFVGWSIHNAGLIAENTAGSYVACGRGQCAKGKEICAAYEINQNKKRVCAQMSSFDRYKEMYNTLEVGDLVYSGYHVMLFIAFYDENKDGINDGIYVLEGANPAGIKIFKYNELYNGKFHAIVKMKDYVSNPTNRACYGYKKSTNANIELPNSWQKFKNEFNTCN